MVAADRLSYLSGCPNTDPMSRIKNTGAFLLIWLVISLTTPSFIHAVEPEKLNICYSSIAATSVTTWVPEEADIYQRHGLDVNIIYVSGAQAISTLIAGDTQIVPGSGILNSSTIQRRSRT